MALPHAKPNQIVHLAGLEGSHEAGRVTLAKTNQFTAIRVTLQKDEHVPAHHVQGYATVMCLYGSVDMILDDQTVVMSKGDWLYLDQAQQHAVRSLEESALLVTIMLTQ